MSLSEGSRLLFIALGVALSVALAYQADSIADPVLIPIGVVVVLDGLLIKYAHK